MSTTIQVSKSSRKELLIIKAWLEQQTGVKSTFDDALKWVIAKSRSTSVPERIKLSNELKTITKDLEITFEDLKVFRKERLTRFANF